MKSLSLSQPHLIVMVGIPGSGKSFFAEKFADTFRTPYVSHAKIAAFGEFSSDSIKDIISYQLDELFKTDHSIILDGASETHAQRAELTKKAHSRGYETLYIWVQIDSLTAESRSTKPSKERPIPALTQDEYAYFVKHFTPPNTLEKSIVISGKHTYASQAKVVLKKLSAPRAEIAARATAPAREKQPVSIGRRNITVR
jgi:predicted kinase